jgi:uncharacterized protein
MPRVIHFEIHADQPDRAIAFYSSVFGWQFDRFKGDMPYWLVTTGAPGTPGIDGGMIERRGPRPEAMAAVNCYVCTIDVPNVDEWLAKAEAAGGTRAMEKFAVAGVGWVAYCKDTEGNLFGIMQNDPNAA